MDSSQAYVQRVRLPPKQRVDAAKEIGLKLLASLSTTIARSSPGQSTTVLSATSELLSALPPLRMFKSLAPRCPPEEILTIQETMVCCNGILPEHVMTRIIRNVLFYAGYN